MFFRRIKPGDAPGPEAMINSGNHTHARAPVRRIPSPDRMTSAFLAAWKLVETQGLKRAAYQRLDYETIRDLLYLMGQGVPVKRLVRILNSKQAPARLHRERLALQRAYTGALKQSEFLLTAAHLASVLAELAPGALLAQLQTGNEELRRQALLLWLKQPSEQRRRMLFALSEAEAKAVWFAATSTAATIQERFGPETMARWLRGN